MASCECPISITTRAGTFCASRRDAQVCRRCPVALGRPRRPALVGSRTAGRLCFRRLSGGRPPTIADLAVTPRRRTPAARVSAPDLHHGQQTIWVVVVVV